jgi:YidC/Oxa1 family membrane protein insertase
MSIFAAFGAVVGVAHSAIEGLATLLTPLTGGLAGALAIVVFTLAVRALISPLTYVQVRGERRRTALAPQIEKLRRKHRNDPVTLATETLALQRANGAGPFVSMLPALAQAPFFMIMYRVALQGPSGSLAGVPLTAHLFAGLPVFAVLLAIAGALAWWSSRRIRRNATAPPVATEPGSATAAAPAKRRNKPTGPSNAALSSKAARSGTAEATRMGKAATRPAKGVTATPRPGRSAAPPTELPGAGLIAKIMPWLPYLTLFAVAYLPLAGALYLVTSTSWTALEHALWRRPVITGST